MMKWHFKLVAASSTKRKQVNVYKAKSVYLLLKKIAQTVCVCVCENNEMWLCVPKN